MRQTTISGTPVLDEPALRGRGDPLITTSTWMDGHRLQKGYAVSRERIKELSKAELIELVVQQEPQLTAMELRILYGVWTTTDPTSDRFEAEFQGFAAACRAGGWGLSPKARAATAAGGKEKTMTRSERPEPHVRLAGAAKAYAHNNHLTFDEALAVVAEADPQLIREYVGVPPEPKPAPMVAPTPWSEASVEVAERAEAYAAKHEVDINEATAKVFAVNPGLRRDYLQPPTASKRYGLIAEQTEDDLLFGLTRSELVELAIERKLGAPGLSGQQQDAVAQISLYDWLTSPRAGGLEHGSPEAARARDQMWARIVRERYKRHGLQQPPGRG